MRPGAKTSGSARRIPSADRSRSPAVSQVELTAPDVPDDSLIVAHALERHRPRPVGAGGLQIGTRRQRQAVEVVQRANVDAREALGVEGTAARPIDGRLECGTEGVVRARGRGSGRGHRHGAPTLAGCPAGVKVR